MERVQMPNGTFAWVPQWSEMTADQRYKSLNLNHTPIDFLKDAKTEQMNEACENAILAGFSSSTTGHTYDFLIYDQTNMQQEMLMLLGDSTIDSIEWKTRDVGVISHTRDEFLTVCKEASLHKWGKINHYRDLKGLIGNCKSVQEVDAITWETEV